MSVELGRLLLAAGLVPPEEMEAALFLSVVRGVPLARALVDRGALTEAALEEELARRGGVAARHVVAATDLWVRLPPALCRRLGVVPTRFDVRTSTVEVAAVDPTDPHVGAELAFHLGLGVRVVRAPLGAVEEAIRRAELEGGEESRERRATPRFPHGAPQSSSPPPSHDVPIPLVRRLGVPLIDDPETIEAETRRFREAIEPQDDGEAEVALPLRKTKTPAEGVPRPRPTSGREAARRANTLVSAQAPPKTGTGRPIAPAALGPAEPPAVSFPSSPPPPLDEETIQTGSASRPSGETGSASRPSGETGSRPWIADGDTVVEPDGAPAFRPTVETMRPASLTARPPPIVVPSPTVATLRPAPREKRPSLHAARAELRASRNRDEVVAALLKGLRLCARRVAVFAVRRDGFRGWACNVELGDQDALRRVVLPANEPSVLATAAATGVYLGPLPRGGVHVGLCEVMGATSDDVAVVPVRVRGHTALLLLADDLDDTLLGTRGMEELAGAAGAALEEMLAAR